jgi:hypothetical protein
VDQETQSIINGALLGAVSVHSNKVVKIDLVEIRISSSEDALPGIEAHVCSGFVRDFHNNTAAIDERDDDRM